MVFYFMEKTMHNVGCSSFCGQFKGKDKKISNLQKGFLEYVQYEINLSPATAKKYNDALTHFVGYLGDKEVDKLIVQDFVSLKRKMMQKGIGEARIGNIVFAVRSFLNYCNNFLGIETINPKQIRPPKIKKREVVYLNKEEIEKFVSVIRTHTITGLRFRALVETLLGTGMRISESLSLKRKDINWEKKEAKIISKGNKERMVFFTDRALEWIDIYLAKRYDDNEALFITTGYPPKKLSINDISRFFKTARLNSKIDKPITPHLLRHTVATNLVFNGCPIVHVKEIL